MINLQRVKERTQRGVVDTLLGDSSFQLHSFRAANGVLGSIASTLLPEDLWSNEDRDLQGHYQGRRDGDSGTVEEQGDVTVFVREASLDSGSDLSI